MRAIIIIFVMMGLCCSNPSGGLKTMVGATQVYEKRLSEALNEEEEKAVGRWTGKNREVEWEIYRRKNGIYELVLHEEYEGVLYKDYYRGTWGINDGVYYYFDLQSSDKDAEFDNEPSFEKVVKSTDDEFFYISKGYDGEELKSNERKIEDFKFKLWKKFSKGNG